MIELRSMLKELNQKNISIDIREGDKLVLNGDKKALSPELLDLVKLHKEQLLLYLSDKAMEEPYNNKQVCSLAQRRFWLQEQLHTDVQQAIAFSVPVPASISDDHVQEAFAMLSQRHAILRTTYQQEKEELYQHVQLSGVRVESHYAEKAAWEDWLAQNQVLGLLKKEQIPLKICLLRDRSGEGLLHAIIHHIICEVESLQILKDDFAAILQGLLSGEAAQLTDITHSFTSFAASERQYLNSIQFTQDKMFWENYLADMPLLHSLPLDRPRARQMSFNGESCELIIRGELIERARQFCFRFGLTQHLFLQGIFAISLSAFSKSNDIVIGVPFSNRPTKDYRNVVGLFQNNRICRHLCTRDTSVHSFFQTLQKNNRYIMQHQQMPFEMLVDHINPKRSQQFTPLYQILMISNQVNHSIGGGSTNSSSDEPIGLKAELSLVANIYQDAFDLNLEFNKDIFGSEFVQLVLTQMDTVLQKILIEDAQNLQALVTAPDIQVSEMLKCLSSNNVALPQVSLYDQFSHSAHSAPDTMALVCGEHKISYLALSKRVASLAAEIHSNQGARKVAFYLKPGIDSVVVMLACLKLGIAFIPLSTRLPVQRIDFMLQDSECHLVVTSVDLKLELTRLNAEILCLSEVSIEKSDPQEGLPVAVPEDSAYILFTSGSTGKPKGVEVQQRALASFFQSIKQRLGLKKGFSSVLLTNLGFDIAQLEWLMPLLNQGTCYIADETLQNDSELLASWLLSQHFDLVQSTPSRWLQLVKSGLDRKIADQLICGGEALPPGVLTQLRPLANRVWNAYGPTEATIWSMLSDVTQCDIEARKTLPLSGPLANYQHCILDDQGLPVVKGAVGILHISGLSLAKGYVNRESLSREKFVIREILSGNKQRWYDTGDLVRWSGDAQLEFLGRNDNQVKINGYRFELEEMEVVLSNMPGIEKAALVLEAKEQSGQFLIAFCYLTPQSELEVKDINVSLRKHFPAAVCPVRIKIVKAWPLNNSGKVDKPALLTALEDHDDTPALANGLQLTELERTLLNLWNQVLPSAIHEINLDFFAAGGNSLGLVTLLNLYRERQIPMTIKGLMENPTISGQVDLLKALQSREKQRAQPSNGASDCIVKLNQNLNGTPLFLVHPMLGNAFFYSGLAKTLEDYLPVYGIHAPFMSDHRCPFNNLKTLADYYCKGLETIYPNGPVFLGGASLGGRIAYLMADILQSKGRDIALLLSLDGAPTGIYDTPCASIKLAMQESLKFLLGVEKFQQAMLNQDDLGRDVHLAYAVDKVAEMDLFPGINLSMALNFFLDLHLALPVHHSLNISGTTLHITPKNSPLRDEMNNAWRKNLLSRLIFMEVEGNHMNFMEPPLFNQFATELVEQLLQLNYIRQG